MCVCVCVCVYDVCVLYHLCVRMIYVYMMYIKRELLHAYGQTDTHTYIHAHTCTHIQAHTSTHINTHMYMYVCMYIFYDYH